MSTCCPPPEPKWLVLVVLLIGVVFIWFTVVATEPHTPQTPPPQHAQTP